MIIIIRIILIGAILIAMTFWQENIKLIMKIPQLKKMQKNEIDISEEIISFNESSELNEREKDCLWPIPI